MKITKAHIQIGILVIADYWAGQKCARLNGATFD